MEGLASGAVLVQLDADAFERLGDEGQIIVRYPNDPNRRVIIQLATFEENEIAEPDRKGVA